MIDIYLASPYSHKSEEVKHKRFLIINKYAAKLMREGNIVFSPISHSHPIAIDHKLPGDWEYWQKSCEAFVSVCKSMVVLKLDGWEVSTGVQAEIKLAQELNIPITYIEPPMRTLKTKQEIYLELGLGNVVTWVDNFGDNRNYSFKEGKLYDGFSPVDFLSNIYEEHILEGRWFIE